MKRLFASAHLAIALLLSATVGNAYGDNQPGKPKLVYQRASDQAIAGVWEIIFSGGSYYRYRYVAVTPDGQIGWFSSNTAPVNATAASIMDAITRKDAPGGLTTPWRSYSFSAGILAIATDKKNAQEEYSVDVVTVAEKGNRFFLHEAMVGDLKLQNIYRIPPNWPASAGAPHIQAPPPLHLRLVKE